MNKLNLEFVNLENDFVVTLDGKVCEFKKHKKKRNLSYEYQTENQTAHLTVQRFVPIGAKNWWLWQLLFFFVSVFGLFNRIENKKCVVVDYEADITLAEETNVKIIIRQNSKEKNAVELVTEAVVVEHKNIKSVDKAAKKRVKFIKVFTIVFWILLVILLGILLISLIVS